MSLFLTLVLITLKNQRAIRDVRGIRISGTFQNAVNQLAVTHIKTSADITAVLNKALIIVSAKRAVHSEKNRKSAILAVVLCDVSEIIFKLKRIAYAFQNIPICGVFFSDIFLGIFFGDRI